MTLQKIAGMMHDELARATAKFGRFHTAHEGYAVILEEVDELWDAVKRGDRVCMMREAIQVGAMAMRFVHDLTEE